MAEKKERPQNKNLEKGKATRFKSGEKAEKSGRKGGIASGVAKRKKKLLKDCLEELLEKDYLDKSGNRATGAETVSIALFRKAQAGDIKAFEVLRDTCGQKPIEKVMITEVDQDTINEVERFIMAGLRIWHSGRMTIH